MIRNDAALFGRVITALVTPFTDDLSVDFAAVERLVEHLIATGTSSIVVAGTTGESPTLEDAEKRDLLKAVITAAKGRAKVIMGSGYNATAKTIRASKEAEDLGADGLLIVAPYYNKPNQEGLLAHFTEVSKATSLPFILYNIPGRTGVNVSADTTVQLTRHCGNLHALKDSTNSVEQAAEIARRAREDFQIYSGDDFLTLPFLSVGACGVVSVASHLCGRAIARMIDFHFKGQFEEARRLHYLYLPLFKGLFSAPNPTCVKYALSQLGLCKPHLRLPLTPIGRSDRDLIDVLMSQEQLDMRAPIA